MYIFKHFCIFQALKHSLSRIQISYKAAGKESKQYILTQSKYDISL